MRIVILSSLILATLTACSSYAPPANLTDFTKDELVAKMGPPDVQRQKRPRACALNFLEVLQGVIHGSSILMPAGAPLELTKF